jgi:hypothetical protein
MRLSSSSSAILGVALLLISSAAFATPPAAAAAAPAKKSSPAEAAAKSKVQHDPLPSTRADVSLVGKALLAKDLPKTLPAADRAKLEAAASELKEDHFEAGASIYRTWATTGSPKQLTHEDAMLTAFWVFREGILASKHEEMTTAADRLRFFDERNAALDDSLALLKGAVIAKKPALVARIVVITPYVRDGKGDERKERQVNRDALSNEIKQLETVSEEVKAERDKLRAGFGNADPKSAQILQTLTSLVKSANEMRLASSTK